MGDEKTNVRALIRAQREKDIAAGLTFDANDTTPIEFCHPAVMGLIAGQDVGSTIQCLSFLSSNPILAAEVRFSNKLFHLGLDPSFTAPNAQIGVMFVKGSSRTQHQILVPGDVISVPQGFSRIWCYDASLVYDISIGTTQFGFVRFMASRTRECLINWAKHTTHPQASMIQRSAALDLPQLGSPVGVGGVYFSPSGLKEICVHVFAQTGGGTNIDTWSCGIGLFALNRLIPDDLETPLNFPRNNTMRWSLVDIKCASGLKRYSVWKNPGVKDGNDILVFDTFPNSPLLQIARVSAINNFGPTPADFLYVTVEGNREGTGHKYEKTKIIYDATSVANTLLSTGILDTAEFEEICISITPSGSPTVALTLDCNEIDEAGVSLGLARVTTIASVFGYQITIGSGANAPLPNAIIAAVAYNSCPVPKRISMTIPALGAGITGRIRIQGRTRG